MHKVLVVIDMQNDFISGSLGTREAQAIIPAVKRKLYSYPSADTFYTMDTHGEDYLTTQEGKHLPVSHCIKGSEGWMISSEIYPLLSRAKRYEKGTFGSVQLAEDLRKLSEDLKEMEEEIEIELIGLCTDICVISNALLLKAYLPEVKISVDSACCAGVTTESHKAALEVMKSCQIGVI